MVLPSVQYAALEAAEERSLGARQVRWWLPAFVQEQGSDHVNSASQQELLVHIYYPVLMPLIQRDWQEVQLLGIPAAFNV